MDSTLVIKNSHTYCKNLQVIKNQALRAFSQGDRLVGKDHRSSPTATHKDDNQRTPHVSNLSHNTGIANFNTSISKIHNYSTSTTLILPYSYLKTIIKYPTSHSILCTFYESFYYTHLGCRNQTLDPRIQTPLSTMTPTTLEVPTTTCCPLMMTGSSQEDPRQEACASFDLYPSLCQSFYGNLFNLCLYSDIVASADSSMIEHLYSSPRGPWLVL